MSNSKIPVKIDDTKYSFSLDELRQSTLVNGWYENLKELLDRKT